MMCLEVLSFGRLALRRLPIRSLIWSRDWVTEPPQDLIAEKSVLGCCLLSANSIPEVRELLNPADFYLPAHESIYKAILDLYDGGLSADATAVGAELQERAQLIKIGGAPYLLDLLQTAPT